MWKRGVCRGRRGHLHGFHTYDIDFTFRAYLAGFICVVANNMVVLHDSNVAEFAEERLKEWACEQSEFVERFRKHLPVKLGVRRHDVVSLDKPGDFISVRQEVCSLLFYLRTKPMIKYTTALNIGTDFT